MNKTVFGKTMKNVRKYRDIKLITTDKRRNQLVLEPNFHTTKYFSENLMAIETKKKKVNMNKPIDIYMSILDISKTLLYEFWCDYIKTKYQEKAKLCYIDTDSFITYIKSEDFYEDIENDIEKWFGTSNYDEDDSRPLPIGKKKNVIGLFRVELEGTIMIEFAGPRAKTYAFLIDENTEHKKAKWTKKCVTKIRLKTIPIACLMTKSC